MEGWKFGINILMTQHDIQNNYTKNILYLLIHLFIHYIQIREFVTQFFYYVANLELRIYIKLLFEIDETR